MASHFLNCLRQMPMPRWSKGKGKKNWRPSGRRGSFFKPLLELLEDRRLLSVGATLQGTVVDDSNRDAPLAGATVTLYQQQGSNFVSTGKSVTTGANGSYSFTVGHGTYQLIKTPPAGYTNVLTQITASPVESASQISSSTIQVTVPQTGTLSLNGNQYQAAGTNNPSSISKRVAAIEVLNFEVNSSSSGFVSATASAGQSIASFNGGAPFYTFCVDLGPNDTLKTGNVNNVFTVQPQTDLSGIGGQNVQTADAGKIAYLYDTYGSPHTLSSVDAAALQVAIWSLEYNQNPFLFDSTTQTIPARNNFFLTGADTRFPNSVANYSAVVSQATTYLNDGAGHIAQALFLAPLGPPTSGGEQAFIAPPVRYNFSDVPKATPSINTTQQPASATVGSSIADQARVTGLVHAQSGDTVTFKLYSSATGQNSSTLLFADTETVRLNGSIATATSKSYTTTATGTDFWVATFNGDSNNKSVTSGATAEPVKLSPKTPQINTTQQPASATVGTSIADQATVSGYHPTGTLTFALYNNASASGTPLFTDTENLVNGVATSKGYTATATGTDYWVATYNGDSNNSSVTSSPTAEPVTITPATPQLTTQPSETANPVVGSAVPSMVWLPPWQVSKRSFLSSSDPPSNPAVAAAEEALFNAVVQQWVNLWDALLSVAESLLAAGYDSGPRGYRLPEGESE